MAWNPALSALRDVMVDLYSMSRDAQIVVADAQVDPAAIDFSGGAVQFWHSILTEADKQSKVDAIIDVAHKRFPNHGALAQAVQAYRDAAESPSVSPARPSAPLRLSTSQKHGLATALLATPVMSDRHQRDEIVNQLDDKIRSSIKRSANDRFDVLAIINRCLDFSQGLEQLIETVRLFEDGTLAMQEIDDLMGSFRA